MQRVKDNAFAEASCGEASFAFAADRSKPQSAADLKWAERSRRLKLRVRILGLRATGLMLRFIGFALRAVRLALRAIWLSVEAAHLPRIAPRLVAASAVVVLMLLMLSLPLPRGDDARMLASVELNLGHRNARVTADASAEKILIERAAPAVPPLADVAAATPLVESPEPEAAKTERQEEEPNLAGLADIPEKLIAERPKRNGDRDRRKPSFAAYSETRENLPWNAVEPVVFTPMGPGQQQKAGSPAPQAVVSTSPKPAVADIGNWMKGKATKIMGASRTKPLYHFVVWVEPPKAMQAHVAGVSYDFSSPAVMPQSQASSDRDSGFKINAAGLACADQITVTLRFKDGRIEKTSIDGCELFNKA